MASSGQRLSREDHKKQRELEELRKAGAIPAERDEDGKMINPHIPNYISQAPWYLDTSHPGLKHQRKTDGTSGFSISDIHRYQRKGKKGSVASRYRPGACANCGAMSHQAKDCVERPRKRGAKLTNKSICADEFIDSPSLSYDGKRDRWNGYDPSSYKQVVSQFQRADAARAQTKAEELDTGDRQGDVEQVDSDEDDEEDRVGDDDLKDSGAVIQKRDGRTRTTVRNLRIREDTAKYLLNLDVNSAYYDPKTRSMRENPNPDKSADEISFAGDNFVRFSGDTKDFTKLSVFSWDAVDRGADLHQAAAPSQVEFTFREEQRKKEDQKMKHKTQLIEKYGGTEHLVEQPKELLIAQTENYVEYSRDGKVLKGLDIATKKSKYEEDVLERGHKSIWGSFYRSGRWGYQCCHQTSRNAFCTGEAGKQAAAEVAAELMARDQAAPSAAALTNTHKRKRALDSSAAPTPLAAAAADGPSQEEIERYQRSRTRDGDPMA